MLHPPVKQIVALAEAYVGAADPEIPFELPLCSNRFMHGNPARLAVERAGTTGSLSVYGADYPAQPGGDDALSFVSEGDGVIVDFDTLIPFGAGFSNNNFIVKVNDVVIKQGVGAGEFQVSDQGGFARITFGTAPALNARIEVFLVVPVLLYQDTDAGTETEIRSYDFVWVNLPAASSASNVYVTPLIP